MQTLFIPPCLPRSSSSLPSGPGWLHEPKIDGWRVQLIKAGGEVFLFTRGGHDIASRLTRLLEDLRELPVESFVIDGELVADEADRIGNVFSVQRALGAGRLDQIGIMAFDLLTCEGEDVRTMPLIDRKALLDSFVERASLPWLSFVAGHLDGGALFATMDGLGLEGVVSKRINSPYRSGRRDEWRKVKCPTWRERNKDRWHMFSKG
ncbi:MAG: hypothetical protein KJZ83_00110 [Burkholderiaceae bacterium]|nr:hypothetical protein [Burkholderiaceae bacterium]